MPEKDAQKQLASSLDELYNKGCSRDYSLKDIKLITESFVPEKNYGTALIGICFVNHIYPILQDT